MGLFDKAKDLAADHKDTIDDGIDKAADVVTDKVGEEHEDTVDKGADMAKDALDKLTDD